MNEKRNRENENSGKTIIKILLVCASCFHWLSVVDVCKCECFHVCVFVCMFRWCIYFHFTLCHMSCWNGTIMSLEKRYINYWKHTASVSVFQWDTNHEKTNRNAHTSLHKQLSKQRERARGRKCSKYRGEWVKKRPSHRKNTPLNITGERLTGNSKNKKVEDGT